MSIIFLDRVTRSTVQVHAEADASAPQIHHIAVQIGQFEAEVPQGDGVLDVDQVVVVRAGLHDVADALAANDLGNDVVA